jgi:hypothetical protein
MKPLHDSAILNFQLACILAHAFYNSNNSITSLSPHKLALKNTKQGQPASPTRFIGTRSTEEEKQSQLSRLKAVQDGNKEKADAALEQLQRAVQANENVFEVLMEAGRYCSLGQITDAFFEVGGQYRRNM